jgi:hypothetical protein
MDCQVRIHQPRQRELSLAIIVCWAVWHERNTRVFQGHEKSVSRLVSEIQDEVRLWVRAGGRHLSILVDNPVRE